MTYLDSWEVIGIYYTIEGACPPEYIAEMQREANIVVVADVLAKCSIITRHLMEIN